MNPKYKVLITTSGTGSRLKELTKDTNKALVPVAGKATICWVIDTYPANVPIVVTLGYFGQKVKDFLSATYPDRVIEYVNVDKYEGDGSSLLYSMRTAREHLQCPFIFHACDTLVVEPIPAPDRNWIGGFRVEQAIKQNMPLAQYRTHKVENEKIVQLLDKGVPDFHSIHIGLDGIFDHDIFWKALEDIYQSDPMNQSLSEVHVLDKMLHDGVAFEWVPYDVWLDTGNLDALAKTEEYLKNKK
jgi:NDP-sugar pyrophosphorylase family protein